MKKRLSAILMLVIMLLSVMMNFAACGGTNNDDVLSDGEEGDEAPALNAAQKAYQARCDWGLTTLKVQLSENSFGVVPEQGKRYLEGKSADGVDTELLKSIRDRNAEAELVTNTKIVYSYLPDTLTYSPNEWYKRSLYYDAADICINQVYALYAAALNGFGKLLTSESLADDAGESYFEFNRSDYDPSIDDRGYLYNYMTELSLDGENMFVLTSDYTLSAFRSVGVLPVNLNVLDSLDVSGSKMDANGDGKLTKSELYSVVSANGWNFSAIKELSMYANAKGVYGLTVAKDGSDTAAFMSAQGIQLFTTNGYPYTMPTAYKRFVDEFIALTSSAGVQVVYSGDAIRESFASGGTLLDGVVTLAALEHSDYQSLISSGKLAVTPIPRDVVYDAALHGDAYYRVGMSGFAQGAMIYGKTSYARQCAAWLNYQTISSGDIFNDYCKSLIPNDATATEMIKGMRDSIGGDFDVIADRVFQLRSSIGSELFWTQVYSMDAQVYEYLVLEKEGPVEKLAKDFVAAVSKDLKP